MQRPCFFFGAKETSAGMEYRGIRQRLSFQCSKTKTMDCKTDVIVEPKTASPPEPFAGADHLLSGWLVLAVPLQISPPLLAPFLLNIWEEDQVLYN